MRFALFAVAVVLSITTAALGDGCYIPKQAIRKMPEIDAQRAVLAWKDGVETLVIASALDSEAQSLGWIIPVPAVPVSIEKQSPGALVTLSYCTQPAITHDLWPFLKLAIIVAVVFNILLAARIFRPERFLEYLTAFLLLFLLWSLLLPALSGAGAAGAIRAGGAVVEKSAKVGAYDIAVLRASRPGDLDAWLTENGFAALPAAANDMVADYLSRGWVFTAIKLTRDEAGASTPHPIKLVFPAKEPVYPMKLTALAGGRPQFELFVIAADRASCGLLQEEFCDRFVKDDESRNDDRYETTESFKGEGTGHHIAHAGILPLMWDGCVLTKLSGEIADDDMTADIHFAWLPFRALKQHFYTRQGALEMAIFWFVVSLGVAAAVSMVIFRKRIAGQHGRAWYNDRVVLPGIAILACSAGIVFACLPKLEDSKISVGYRSYRRADTLVPLVQDIVEKHPEVLVCSEQEIGDFLLKQLYEVNNVTGGTRRQEDSPGNFTIEKQANQVVVRVYENDGRAIVTRFRVATPAP